MPEEIISRSINDEMITSYMLYSMSVIVGRAIPDVRDGLKPVQRKILFGMLELGLRHNQSYKKSARIVGEVMGKFHPHGDMAIYDALVRMAQPFSMRYPLIQGQGNFGSIDRDPPAAMRYTEARMQRLAEELLADIDKNTVKMIPNFDGSLIEPEVLPAKAPNLLMNGASGIAVGMMTNIPPHNLSELVEALTALIDNPDATIEELMEYVKGPDFPTGGIIMGRDGIKKMYETGRGRMVVRGVAEIEEAKGGTRIVISEIPYGVSKADLIQQIANVAQNVRDIQVRNVRDESDKRGLRVVIELKRGADPNVVLNLLYKHTQLQTTFGAHMLVIDEKKRPKLMNLKEIFQAFIKHRYEVVKRRTEYELEQASKKAHILEGLTKASRAIDTVVDIIRNSKNIQEASVNLQETLEITPEQSQAILEMRLGKLTALEIDKLVTEYAELVEKIKEYREILSDDKNIYQIIKKELQELEAQYGDARRTKISIDGNTDFNVEDVIPDDEVVVTVTKKGYIKATPLEDYRKQGRGGKGIRGVKTTDADFVTNVVSTTRLSKTVVITSKGKAYFINNYELECTSRSSRGKLLANYVKIEPDETVQAVLSVKREEVANKHLIITTRKGKIKRTPFEAFINSRTSGIKAITLNEGDSVVDAGISTSEEETIIISTRKGMVIRFPISQIRPMGRTAAGVKAMALRGDDEVVSATIVLPVDERYLFTATERGVGKRTPLSEYRPQHRAGMGVKNIYGLERTGYVVGSLVVTNEDEIIVITKNGMSIRIPAADIRPTGRVTKGVKVVELRDDDTVASLAVVVDQAEV
ncbi:DNA gyrase subunit A [Kosmotoga olearia]|uniref:DNA gyrase subunit A n=1 Tax=Kosmotoga olearia (strain ATCC BAA-1733 / DSM 21960 / TBF 19.5.1) TaxID=521045 RepID=GYRA_KOSOT|nr:DNA gyrase subunit A [Kosmotoga olearia]C5CHA8.1 RecName: Full=DNA gyrase subunit A [Kosmotoga olearia TBF 19.5.1]ACR78747.1 DNA gyrase, A subunit [Kosmotoga olearia TBF 19.5.1]MDK2952651.1 gyrase subunit [Kosmotoga sp.]